MPDKNLVEEFQRENVNNASSEALTGFSVLRI